MSNNQNLAKNVKRLREAKGLSQEKLAIDFKNPWNYLAEMPAEARGEAPSEATNRLWWCLLEKVRTHFEQNPD